MTDNKRRFSIYHPNGKGTGSAIDLKLIPANGISDGSVVLTLAPQRDVASREGVVRIFPTFEWADAIGLRLTAMDIGHVLSVLRGCEESIADGLGLIHVTKEWRAKMTLEHVVEPVPAYRLTAFCKKNDGTEQKVGISLSHAEACVLESALSASMGRICFGD